MTLEQLQERFQTESQVKIDSSIVGRELGILLRMGLGLPAFELSRPSVSRDADALQVSGIQQIGKEALKVEAVFRRKAGSPDHSVLITIPDLPEAILAALVPALAPPHAQFSLTTPRLIIASERVNLVSQRVELRLQPGINLVAEISLTNDLQNTLGNPPALAAAGELIIPKSQPPYIALRTEPPFQCNFGPIALENCSLAFSPTAGETEDGDDEEEDESEVEPCSDDKPQSTPYIAFTGVMRTKPREIHFSAPLPDTLDLLVLRSNESPWKPTGPSNLQILDIFAGGKSDWLDALGPDLIPSFGPLRLVDVAITYSPTLQSIVETNIRLRSREFKLGVPGVRFTNALLAWAIAFPFGPENRSVYVTVGGKLLAQEFELEAVLDPASRVITASVEDQEIDRNKLLQSPLIAGLQPVSRARDNARLTDLFVELESRGAPGNLRWEVIAVSATDQGTAEENWEKEQ